MFTEICVRPSRYMYEADLSNGDTIFVNPDGTAESVSGAKYEEITETDTYGDIIHCGWEYISTE